MEIDKCLLFFLLFINNIIILFTLSVFFTLWMFSKFCGFRILLNMRYVVKVISEPVVYTQLDIYLFILNLDVNYYTCFCAFEVVQYCKILLFASKQNYIFTKPYISYYIFNIHVVLLILVVLVRNETNNLKCEINVSQFSFGHKIIEYVLLSCSWTENISFKWSKTDTLLLKTMGQLMELHRDNLQVDREKTDWTRLC